MEFKEQLREQVDIVRVVGDYVRLRRAGKRYSGLCPFHNEKTPSFSVSPEHQYFRCFGCDAKGDVFKFVEMIEGLTFFEALKKLADQHGMALPKQSFASDEETRLKAALHEMHEIAADHFRSNLAGPNGAATREYLSKRGVGEAAVQQFGLGLAEGSGRSLLRILEKRGFKPEQIEASGLAGQRDDGSFYDRFRNRLMFPIQNESGKVIAFGGRALDPEDKAKYLNSPETKIYRKSNVLYNLHRAKETAMKLDRIVLVEGYMDAIGAWQAGVREVVASCGTALTVEQIRAMKRHSLNLHLNFDPDAAGAKASERSVKLLLDESMKVRIVELEGGLDPDEYCKQHGAEAYMQRVAGAKTYFYWLADRARAKFNMREPQGRVDAFQSLVPAIQDLSDKLARVTYANDLAGYLGVDQGIVLEHFRKLAADRVDRSPVPKTDPTRATDRILLPLLVNDGDARAQLVDYLRELPALKQLTTAPIFDIVIAMHDAGETLNFNTIHERLNPSLQESLAAVLLDSSASGATLEDGLACVEALRRTNRESLVQELKTRIKSAEREGRIKEALELARELSQIG
ncbi:MAG: DNA primase [Bryobacteraceae bacterium]|jgi:DNA primase